MKPEERTQKLAQLHEKASELAERIGIPPESLPPFGELGEGNYVDYDGLYRLISRERGQEVDHRLTLDEDELMYWIFSGITWGMALKYELRHRIPDQDSRRMWFGYQCELLEKLSPAWGIRRKREQAEILARAPYRDE